MNPVTTTATIQSQQLHTILDSFFLEASAAQYIAAINTFVRQRIENATPDECSDMFQILKLNETLAALESIYYRNKIC